MDFNLITDEPLNYCVYAHVNKQNGKMYIGITNNVQRRWEYNGIAYKNCAHFWNAINKYGWDCFEHMVLIDNISFSIACEMEIYLIKKYNTVNQGYNISLGGTGTKIRSKPVYQYDLKGNFIRSWDNPSLAEDYYDITPCAIHETSTLKSIGGFQWSFEYFERMPPYETHNKRYITSIYQYDIDGSFIKKWDYLNDAINEYGLYTKLNADGVTKTAYGFRWSYQYCKKLQPLPIVTPKPRQKKPKELLNTLGNTPSVYRFDLSGQLIKIYDNCRAVSFELNVNPRTIYKLCNKWDQFVYFDSVWVYKEDSDNGYVQYIIDRHKKMHPIIIQYDLDGNYVKEYETMKEVEEAGYSRTGVSSVCNGKTKTSGRYQWRYDYDTKPGKISKLGSGVQTPIIQKTLNGEYVARYNNATEAIFAVTGKRKCASNILAVCKGKQKKSYGYLWEFADQEVNKDGKLD